MVHYFIYAKDYSASTDGMSFYHINGLKTVEQFKSDVKNITDKLSKCGKPEEYRIVYLHWGHECIEVDEKTTVDDYMKKKGTGNATLPDTIIEWIKRNINDDNIKIELLYIITDGQIHTRSMDKCLELNEDLHYESVVFHAFHENLNRIDLSVAVSFLTGRCTIYRNYMLFDDTDISEEYDYSKINLSNFATEKENMKSYIKLKYIKKQKQNATALGEIEKLKKLRDRLFDELSTKSQKTKNTLDTKDKNVFLLEFVNTDWYRGLNLPAHDVKVDIEKSISTLINYIVSEKKSYMFDALKFDTKFDNSVEEEPIVDVNFKPEQEIQFPDIILDDEKGVPVVLLTEFDLLEKLIFHRTKTTQTVSPASFSKFKAAMECPLFLLNDADINESIGYFYTLNVYKQLLEQPTKTEPRTRRPFQGGLVLVDTDEFDKYNDYIIAATYFDFKKVNYNVGLFYYVLWKICENKEWMDKNVVAQFKKYVMRRISRTRCKIGLSSLPLDPQENTSLLTALWYCVELSTILFKKDTRNFVHERLRMHYGVAHCMIEILKYFEYDLDLDAIEKRRDLIRHVMILKKIHPHTERVYYMLEKIFKSVNGFLVSEIENPGNVYKLNYLKLDHKGMLCDDVINGEIRWGDFVHLMHVVDDGSDSGHGDIKICEKTFRPYFTIDENRSFYTDLVKITKKVVINKENKINYDAIDSLEFDRILSLYNLFINCVKDFKKYPTLDEYLKYISKKKKFNGDLVTIFATNFYFGVEQVYSTYQNIMTNVDVQKFIKVSESFVSRFERIKKEEILKFNNDNDINKFISNEESKVNLIKRV